MKILQINNVYGEKSTGKITQEIHQGLLAQGHESLVVFGRGAGVKERGVIRLCPDWYGKINALLCRISGMPYGGCLLSTWHLQRIILREKPDVVHLQCINGNFVNIYRLIRWLKNHKIKTVCSLHAEFMYTANCGHAFGCEQWKHGCKSCPDKKKANKSYFSDRTEKSWKAMYKAFSDFEKDCVICPVSSWTQERAEQGDILKKFSFRTVWNGVNTAVFCPGEDRTEEKMVLNVTACHCDRKDHPKGGWYLTQLAKKMPDVTFLVAGSAEQEGQLPENLTLLGQIRDQHQLAAYYRKATVSVLVSQKETFSLPCAESLCCGTPVVGFRAGAPEQIALAKHSEFVEHGDLDALETVLRRWLARTDLDSAQIARDGAAAYSTQTMVNNFLEVYRSMIWS